MPPIPSFLRRRRGPGTSLSDAAPAPAAVPPALCRRVEEILRSEPERLHSPTAILDLDRARANAAAMIRRAQGVPIRLATKSVRIPALIDDLLGLPGITGLMAYSLAEALWLSDWLQTSGTQSAPPDILVAYPTVDRPALARLAADPALCEAVTLMVDCPEHLSALREIDGVGVCLDIDASYRVGPLHLGARRSPIHTVEEAVGLVRSIIEIHPGAQIRGIMAYEGQIAGSTDTSPAVRAMKARSIPEIAARRAAIVEAVTAELQRHGRPPLAFVNGGGTGSIESTAAESCVTEIGAGSGVLAPGLFDHYRAFRPEPAMWSLHPVVRRPSPEIVTVFGGGRVASGAPGMDRLPTVDYPEGLRFLPMEGAGEVQTPLRGEAAIGLDIGDVVWFRHAKAGEQCEWLTHIDVFHSQATCHEQWTTYRGEGQSFS